MALKAADFLRWVLGGPDGEGKPTSLAKFIQTRDTEIYNKFKMDFEDDNPGKQLTDQPPQQPKVTSVAGTQLDKQAGFYSHIFYRLDSEYRGQNTGQRPTRDFTLDGSIIRARRYWVEIHHWYSENRMDRFPADETIRMLEDVSEHLHNRIGHHGEVIYDFDETGKFQYRNKSKNYFSRISVIDIPPLVEVTIPS